MKKGFATSAILYTLLLLFMAVMVGILNNLENKKTILDALKQDTINALEQDTMIDAILDQIGIINQKISDLSENVYTKKEIDTMIQPYAELYNQANNVITTGFNPSYGQDLTVEGGYVKLGRMVMGDFEIQVNSNVGGNTCVIAGLPGPYYTVYNGSVTVTSHFGANSAMGFMYGNQVCIEAGGGLSPGKYGVHVSYISAG